MGFTLKQILNWQQVHICSKDIHYPVGYKAGHVDTDFLTLLDGEEICFRAKIEEGTASDHTKHRCVSKAWFAISDDDHYTFQAELTGNLSAKDVLEKSLEILSETLDEQEADLKIHWVKHLKNWQNNFATR